MKKNKKYDELLDKLSIEQLEKMIKQKKIDIEITKLNIIKKDLINKQLEELLNN
ncbi:MAG: hypothetical protein IKF36_01305 [Bacilli bacterium]|nr:hypothetical protein [Bacilli bacterium]